MASTKAGTASTKAVSERKLKYWTRILRTQLNDVRDDVGDDGLLTVIKQSLRKEELPKFAALAAQPIEKGDKMKAQVAERLADSSRAFLALLGWRAARPRWRKPTQVVRPPPAQRSVAPTMGPAPEHVLAETSTCPV